MPRGRTGLTVALLGAGGFVGQHIATAGDRAGHRLVAVPRHVPLADFFARHRPDVVVNAAGAVSDDARVLVEANLRLVRRLIRAAAGVPRLVHLGSSLEYGPAEPGSPIAEAHPTAPESVHARAKLRATELVLAASRAGGPEAVVLRLFNVVGPGMPAWSLPGLVAARLAAAARTGDQAELRLRPLRSVRDFVDVRDVADAVIAALPAADAGGRVVNIGAGRAVPVRAVVDQLVAIAGVPARVVTLPDAADGSLTVARLATASWQCADIGRAADLLAWRPRRSLATSLADLWSSVRPSVPAGR